MNTKVSFEISCLLIYTRCFMLVKNIFKFSLLSFHNLLLLLKRAKLVKIFINFTQLHWEFTILCSIFSKLQYSHFKEAYVLKVWIRICTFKSYFILPLSASPPAPSRQLFLYVYSMCFWFVDSSLDRHLAKIKQLIFIQIQWMKLSLLLSIL